MSVSACRSIAGCSRCSARASGEPSIGGATVHHSLTANGRTLSGRLVSSSLRPRMAADVLALVGGTPLVAVRGPEEGRDGRAAVWAKMEQANPGGSVKDRICLAMIEEAERSGQLVPGGVVVEPTSGNTGIGLALVCAVRGYRCVLTMPESMSLERRQLLEAFGAEVVLTPEAGQMEGAVARAREIARSTPGAFMPQQFDNPANPRVHAETTAREILQAMQGLS